MTRLAEEIAAPFGVEVERTKVSLPALMEAATAPGVVFAGTIGGGYIFPEFLPAFDALMSLGKLLELLAPRAGAAVGAGRRDPDEHARAQDGGLPVVAQGHRDAHGHRGAADATDGHDRACSTASRCSTTAAGRRSCPTPTRRSSTCTPRATDTDASEQMAERFVAEVRKVIAAKSD